MQTLSSVRCHQLDDDVIGAECGLHAGAVFGTGESLPYKTVLRGSQQLRTGRHRLVQTGVGC